MKNKSSSSLAATLNSEWDGRFTSGMTKAVNGEIYTSQDHKTATYPRNPSLWCADIATELTAISPWNSMHSNKVGGTLITKRHIITSAHAALSITSTPLTVRFVDADSNVHTRTIIGYKTSANWSGRSGNRSDFRIYTLDSDLPDSIKPCKIMPSNWEDYLPDLDTTRPPQLALDQEEKAIVVDLRKMNSDYARGAYPTDASRLIFSEPFIGGDSGNPSFLIVDPDPNDSSISSELVLTYVLTYGGAGAGSPLVDIPLLNSTIADSDADASSRSGASTISTGYTVTEADFSYYTNYKSILEEESKETDEVQSDLPDSGGSPPWEEDHNVGVGTTSSPNVGVGTTSSPNVGVGTTSSPNVGVGTTSSPNVGVGTTSSSEEVKQNPPEEVEPADPEEVDLPSLKEWKFLLKHSGIYIIGTILLLYIIFKSLGVFSALSKYLDSGL